MGVRETILFPDDDPVIKFAEEGLELRVRAGLPATQNITFCDRCTNMETEKRKTYPKSY